MKLTPKQTSLFNKITEPGSKEIYVQRKRPKRKNIRNSTSTNRIHEETIRV